MHSRTQQISKRKNLGSMVSTPIKDEGLVGKLYPRSEFRDHSRQFFGDSLMICPPEKKHKLVAFEYQSAWCMLC